MAFTGKKVGNILIGAGALLGVLTVVAVVVDYAPTLSPEMIKLMFHKGMAAGAAGLLIVGSWIARGSRRHTDAPRSDSGTLEAESRQKSLSEGAPLAPDTREPDHVRSAAEERR